MAIQSIPVSNNEPAELFDARSRIAQLEAKLGQADYLLEKALESSDDREDMVRKMQLAQKTLKEALGQNSDLMTFA